MTKITVTEKTRSEETFSFIVDVDGQQHEVTLSRDYYQKLTDGYHDPDELVRQSFRFLLEKEKPEDIMTTFDLKQINSYFPGYEKSVRQLLA